MMDYIPLTTYDYKLAFCQSTTHLPNDVQRIIWNKVLDVPPPSTPPKAPTKPSKQLDKMMNNWRSRRRLNF